MAIFEGSVQEFHQYVGPRIRNAINSFARSARNARNGICEECGKSGQELDSAHVHGKDRRTIIEAVLSRYGSVDGMIRCDVATVEKQILDGHGEDRQALRFLCKTCHLEYDNRDPVADRPHPNREFRGANSRGSALQLLFFPDEAQFKTLLLRRRRAYVLLLKSDGRLTIREWNASRFTTSSSLRGNLFSGYLRDWRARGIIKAAFAIERSELDRLAKAL